MSKSSTARHAFGRGIAFLREHPQLWFTAFVACVIVAAFIFVAFRFTAIAQHAQGQLFNDRAGWLLDSFVLFAPDVLENQVLIRTRVQALMQQNKTIDSLTIIAPYNSDAYRLYITPSGEREGTLTQDALTVQQAHHAWATPAHAVTTYVGAGSDRRIVTMRAILNEGGAPQAIAVLTMRLSEADRLVQAEIYKGIILLVGVLLVVMALFVRHARIVDYATLYKKQLEVDELKDSFISMASHELKSPLSVIRGYIEYLRDGQLSEDDRKEYFRRVDVSAEELRQLIDDILDVSRIEMGRLRFTPEYVAPSAVVHEVCDMFKDAAASKGLVLERDVPDELSATSIRVDRGRLKQALINLVSNSVKYTLTGTVTVRLARNHERLELAVHDTGIGMTSEEQKKLFQKFYRVEAEEARSVSGTGLGLWITGYIVEHMEGALSVESIKGEGSRFVMSFPVRSQNEDSSQA